MVKCISNKKIYYSRETAEEALIGAHIQFEYPAGQGPVAVYQCEDCGNYHLTSQGPVNSTLAQFIKEGKIARQKEANQWLNKLKKR